MTSATRLRILLDRQSSIARKIYNCVPASESWTYSQVEAELYRNHVQVDQRVLRGCLASLLDDGLIKSSGEKFQRIQVGEKQVAAAKTNVPVPSVNPLDELSDIASVLVQLSKRIENLALSIEERSVDNDEEMKKLRTLKDALAALK